MGLKQLQVIRHKTRFLVSLFLLSVVISPGCRKKEAQPDDPMPRLWVTQLPSEVYFCSPVLSIDEKKVFIGTSAIPGVNKKYQFFIALDANTGTEIWRMPLGINGVRSAPSVDSDNSIFFTVETRDPVTGIITGDELWHISAEGNFIWKYDINQDNLTIEVGLSAPTIGSDGTVYVGGDKLYAVNPDGSLKWTFTGLWPEAIRNAPAIGSDGTIYFVYHNIPLTALNPDDGSVKWSLPLGVDDHCFSSPAIGTDGTIYVATQPGILYAVSQNGNLLWTFDIASVGFTGVFRSSPSIDKNGSLYFGLNAGNPSSAFFAVNSGGSLKWIFEPGDLPDDVPDDHFDIYSSPAIGTDGMIYFGQEFGRVYALRGSDGSIAAMAETSSGITWSSPAIDKNGALYICDLNGKVFAFQTTSDGLDPEAQWPKYRYDNQNTGRINNK